MSNPELSLLIRREASRLGFFKIGITRACSLPDGNRFAQWLAEGRHGEMHYMERQAPKRQNPGLVLEGVRTIVVPATNYYSPYALSDEPLHGRISRYAWGEDYHEIIKPRLERLLRFIKEKEPSARGICYVDTGPIMEKVWGSQGALGWIGKHTNLITRDQGSWFFTGVILLDIELEYETPEKDYCGKCTRCIAACPTGAIIAPYVLDARLCISYLTIELRGPIPVNLRPLIGNRIFGCDDCQEVCPWNRFAARSPEAGFAPRPGNLMPELIGLARISPDEFRKRFRDAPVWRATRDGFVRNVVIALGNSGNPEAVPVLQSALQDPSPLVQHHAQWALDQIQQK